MEVNLCQNSKWHIESQVYVFPFMFVEACISGYLKTRAINA